MLWVIIRSASIRCFLWVLHQAYVFMKKWETLRKHAYSNILKISSPKTENFRIKISDIFHTSVQNIDCGYSLELPRRGGSNKYPQSMFLSKNIKTNVYPCISYIIRFLINVQVQGQHPHQWAPFQIAGLLHAWQISHQISRYIYHEGW